MADIQREVAPEGSILIWHTSDWHLCGAQYGSTSRGLDFFNSVYNTLHREFKAGNIPDFIINSGDIFDNPRPTSNMHSQLMQINSLLREYGVPMFAITGNHDLASPTWLQSLFKDNKDRGIVCIDDRKIKHFGVHIVGASYKDVQHFRKTGVVDTGDILVLHAPVQEFVSFESEKNYRMSDLPTGSFRAILLGDIHQAGYIVTDDNCLVGYPGSTEMCDKDEPLDKTFTVLAMDSITKEVKQMKPIEVETRDFWTGTINTEAELAQAILEIGKMDRPVVDFDYNREIKGILPKMYSATEDPSEALLRYRALPKINDIHLVEASQKNLTPGDFLTAVLGTDRPAYMYKACHDFINQNPDAYLNLDVSVNHRLRELQEQ